MCVTYQGKRVYGFNPKPFILTLNGARCAGPETVYGHRDRREKKQRLGLFRGEWAELFANEGSSPEKFNKPSLSLRHTHSLLPSLSDIPPSLPSPVRACLPPSHTNTHSFSVLRLLSRFRLTLPCLAGGCVFVNTPFPPPPSHALLLRQEDGIYSQDQASVRAKTES
jgi:hypothetical protein